MTTRKTLKWWKKVFWRLVDISIVNAWIIYKQNYPLSPVKTQRLFRLHLILELVQPLLTLRSSTTCPPYLQGSGNRVRMVASASRLVGKHFAYKSTKRGRCAVCNKVSPSISKRKDKKIQNHCPKCDVYLCLGQCFELYHPSLSL